MNSRYIHPALQASSNMPLRLLAILLLLLAAQACSQGQFTNSNGQCQTCPINTFNINGAGSSCFACSNCTNCISTTGSCTRCHPGQVPSASSCVACPEFTYSVGYGGCLQCSDLCGSCDITNGNCWTCIAGYELAGSSCKNCPDKSFSFGGSEPCLQCTGCSFCNATNGECSSCQAGYQLNNGSCQACQSDFFNLAGTSKCKPCDSSCVECSPLNGSCTLCSVGSQPNGSICTPCENKTYSNGKDSCQSCDSSCVQCSSINGSCTLCQVGSQPNDLVCTQCENKTYSNGVQSCQLCHQSCLQCSSFDGACTLCSAGSQINGSVCTQCTNNTYSNGNQTCQACDSSCLKCSSINGSCGLCEVGKEPSGMVCLTCGSREYSNGSDKCASCDKSCLECQNIQGNCTSCLEGNQPNGTICSPCAQLTFSLGLICQSCHSSCLNCHPQSGACLTCSQGYQVNFTTSQCSICPENTFNSDGTGSCLPCQGCMSCNPTIGDCLSCYDGYGLVDGNCSLCQIGQYTNSSNFMCQECDVDCLSCNGPDNQSCLSCPEGTGLINSTCQLCPSNGNSNGLQPCFLCSTTNCLQCDPTDICTACQTNYTLLNQSCLSCMVQSCISCSQEDICEVCQGMLEPSGNGSLCVICQLTNCRSCSAEEYCQICQADYLPVQGICWPCGVKYCNQCDNSTGTCQICQESYILNSSSNECQPNCTIDNCISCLQPNMCSSCSTNYSLNSTSNSCVFNCGLDSCLICLSQACIQCQDQYLVLGQICAKACQVDNCLQCVEGEIGICEQCERNLTVSADGTACLLCQVDNCLSCADEGICGQCQGDTQVQKGVCIICQVDNCASCSENNLCDVCSTGYSLNSESTTTNDQCIFCQQPCSSCHPDGSCSSCLTPYSQVALFPGNSCFLCADPRCLACSNATVGSCEECQDRYLLIDGQCSIQCSEGCSNCTDLGDCLQCQETYYYMDTSNNSCVLCPNTPVCLICDQMHPTLCLVCSNGYYLADGECLPCQGYCSICTSNTTCTALNNQDGYVIVTNSNGEEFVAACNSGCLRCSSTNPTLCSQCAKGLYLINSQCQPCQNACQSCSSINASVCLTCFSNYYMSDSTCLLCPSPCYSCTSSQLCTSCLSGYVLVQTDSSCIDPSEISSAYSIQPVQNCASSVMSTSDGVNSISCSLCMKGYTLTSRGCAPCTAMCQICSSNGLTNCLQCASGYLLTSNNLCQESAKCPAHCSRCTYMGCLACQSGYYLNQAQLCQIQCLFPCLTCSLKDPLTCLSCLAGYFISNSTCLPDIECNNHQNCQYCPMGYILVSTTTATTISKRCQLCSEVFNCARCRVDDIFYCTSCSMGWYLAGSVCLACSDECSSCIEEDQCTSCRSGYLASSIASITTTVSNGGIVTCQSCAVPCLSCQEDVYSCTSCPNGFTLTFDVCLSNFNYQLTVVFATTLLVFGDNYLIFLNQVATALRVRVNDMVVSSITEGSVVAQLLITSYNDPGSAAAISDEARLTVLLRSGTLGNMPISTYTLRTNGGSNNVPSEDDSGSNSDNPARGGLSTTQIIVIAIAIPVSIFILVGAIVVIFCVRRLRSFRDGQTDQASINTTGYATGRQVELISRRVKIEE